MAVVQEIKDEKNERLQTLHGDVSQGVCLDNHARDADLLANLVVVEEEHAGLHMAQRHGDQSMENEDQSGLLRALLHPRLDALLVDVGNPVVKGDAEEVDELLQQRLRGQVVGDVDVVKGENPAVGHGRAVPPLEGIGGHAALGAYGSRGGGGGGALSRHVDIVVFKSSMDGRLRVWLGLVLRLVLGLVVFSGMRCSSHGSGGGRRGLVSGIARTDLAVFVEEDLLQES